MIWLALSFMDMYATILIRIIVNDLIQSKHKSAVMSTSY